MMGRVEKKGLCAPSIQHNTQQQNNIATGWKWRSKDGKRGEEGPGSMAQVEKGMHAPRTTVGTHRRWVTLQHSTVLSQLEQLLVCDVLVPSNVPCGVQHWSSMTLTCTIPRT